MVSNRSEAFINKGLNYHYRIICKPPKVAKVTQLCMVHRYYSAYRESCGGFLFLFVCCFYCCVYVFCCCCSFILQTCLLPVTFSVLRSTKFFRISSFWKYVDASGKETQGMRVGGRGWVMLVKRFGGNWVRSLLQGSSEALNTNSLPVGSRQRLKNYFGTYPISSSGK